MRGNTVRVISFFFCFFYFLFFGQAQSPLFKNYNVKEGLPSSETYEVFQDSKGYIWVATDRGVSRFDGYEFKTFTTDDGLPDNVNFGFYEDHKGRIWLKSYSDKLCYYLNGEFHALNFNKPLPKEHVGKICNSLCVDNSDTLWIGFEKGSVCMKVGLNEFNQHIPKIISLNQKGTLFLRKIKGGGLLYGGTNSLAPVKGDFPSEVFCVNEDGTECGLKTISDQSSLNGLQMTRMAKGKNETFIIGRGHSLYQFKSDSFASLNLLPFHIISLMAAKEQALWIGTRDEGLLYFSNRNNLLNPVRFLEHLSITSVIEDTEGGYWFSTLESGIFYVANMNFLHYTKAQGLSTNKVNCLAVSSENTLWLGLNNGKVNSVKNGKVLKEFDCNLLSNSINNITSIECLKNGWVPVGGEVFSIIKNGKPPVLFSSTLKASFFSKRTFPVENGLLIAGATELIQVDFLHNDYKMKSVNTQHRLYSLCKDDEGITWMGTPKGLLKYDGKEIKSHLEKTINFRIDDLKKDTSNYLWVASKGKGIFIVKDESVLLLNKNKGLVSDFCSDIFIDSDNIVWAGTNKGISKIKVMCYQPFIYEIENYSTTNGLISDEINQIIVKGDSVYVATNDGVSIFNKNVVKPNDVEPRVHIRKFQVNDSIYLAKDNYHLNYDQNFIKINFIGLSYKDAGNIEYKYRLIGLDSIWHFSKHTSIDYTTLPYGTYTFEVMAKNSDGYWSSKAASISFAIAPPFWHTWWFRIVSGVGLIAFMFLIVRNRIRVVEKRADEKTKLFQKAAEAEKEKLELYQKATDMEMRFLGSQMNPHFTFNAMNSIQKFILNKEPLTAQRYLSQYSKLIRRVLENNMKQFVKLDQEIEMLELYMEIEAARFENKFDFEISLSEDFEDEEYEIPPMIIQPYVENAIWHGLANKENGIGKITLNFSLEKECIKCTIEDNGIGRERAALFKSKKEHTSVGMLITSQRLQQLHSNDHLGIQNTITDLKDSSGMVLGTKVEVYLPIYKDEGIKKVPLNLRDFSRN